MQIRIENLCKKFQSQWIFKNIQFEFNAPNIYGIAGPNGSGKSTLLQILAGLIPPTKGTVQHKCGDQILPEDQWYKNLCYAAPYAEVYEYLTAGELLNHHQYFRTLYGGLGADEFIELCYLKGHEHKWIKAYSSGMKQRLRLALSILTESKILLLDEPLTNLDEKAISWYQNLLADYSKNRLIIIASNDQKDFRDVTSVLDLHHAGNRKINS